jgi:hypothetical protein
VKVIYLADKENLFQASQNGKYSLLEQELHDMGINSLLATAKQGFFLYCLTALTKNCQ